MTHEVVLQGYNVKPGSLQLGTFDSYGIEKIHVTADDEWAGLDILAVFHAPDGTATKVVVGADGMLAVPPEATAKQAGNGRIVFVGLAENVQRITVDMGYNIKPHSDIEGDNPGTPTPDVVQQILANSNNAVSIATAAQNAAENARQAAEDAAKKAGEGAGGAAASAAAAKKSAEDAAASSESAAGKAEESASSASAAAKNAKAAQTAQGSAENAAQTAADAAGAARQAAGVAGSAAKASSTSAGEAAQRAEAAETAKQRAEDAAKKALEAKTGSENALQDADAAKDAASGYADAAAEKATAAAASEKNAAKSANSAADSAAAAKKSAEDADNTANSIKDSMAQISENKEAVSQLKEDTAALKKRQNVLVGSETGNPISCNDAYSAPLCGLTVYGKSTQDGTPTPDAPVPIVSAGDGGSVVVKVSDGNGKEQTLTLPTPNGLPGIPVTSGGNYTDQNGQQWVCDEVDLERGVRVQMVTTMVFSDSSGFAANSTPNGIRFLRAVKNLKITDTATADANAFCSALALGANGGTWLTPDVFTITKTALYVRFKNITSLGELQQYLQQTPMSLTAILATPIETPLFPAEIAAYKALTAYAPDTVVQASDGAGIKLDYQRDVNLVVKNLEDAIASMTTT
jgi:hypothetical protein